MRYGHGVRSQLDSTNCICVRNCRRCPVIWKLHEQLLMVLLKLSELFGRECPRGYRIKRQRKWCVDE
jgi:hypothetical protein